MPQAGTQQTGQRARAWGAGEGVESQVRRPSLHNPDVWERFLPSQQLQVFVVVKQIRVEHLLRARHRAGHLEHQDAGRHRSAPGESVPRVCSAAQEAFLSPRLLSHLRAGHRPRRFHGRGHEPSEAQNYLFKDGPFKVGNDSREHQGS